MIFRTLLAVYLSSYEVLLTLPSHHPKRLNTETNRELHPNHLHQFFFHNSTYFSQKTNSAVFYTMNEHLNDTEQKSADSTQINLELGTHDTLTNDATPGMGSNEALETPDTRTSPMHETMDCDEVPKKVRPNCRPRKLALVSTTRAMNGTWNWKRKMSSLS